MKDVFVDASDHLVVYNILVGAFGPRRVLERGGSCRKLKRGTKRSGESYRCRGIEDICSRRECVVGRIAQNGKYHRSQLLWNCCLRIRSGRVISVETTGLVRTIANFRLQVESFWCQLVSRVIGKNA